MILSEIWIYPIKSLGGISLSEATVEERGLQYDRRWMLVDAGGKFITQRKVHAMTLIDVSFAEAGFLAMHRSFPQDPLFIPFEPKSQEPVQVKVWDDDVEAITVSDEADRWFSRYLRQTLRLVKMPEASKRLVDSRYAQHGESVSFADGYPLLVIGQASLDELNKRLPEPVSMRRFRPNLVVTGTSPFAEDYWTDLQIGSATFNAVKPCARCVLTTIDPDTGQTGAEPLKTLATYRKHKGKILFGMNLLAMPGHIAVGDRVEIH
ncbi:MOSC domain-containing protein [Salmonirosea aquatica]|uniref:MOSC domain-containing protein n=1 Tax=Salmonirosea aquatica TaxID=2654236 RepID=A0A7C9BFX4_9BACT|nr:MOSC domain-containing protein [Cytophagaceae bacterium SJW1-29]